MRTFMLDPIGTFAEFESSLMRCSKSSTLLICPNAVGWFVIENIKPSRIVLMKNFKLIMIDYNSEVTV